MLSTTLPTPIYTNSNVKHITPVPSHSEFELFLSVVQSYADITAPFGFGGLGELVYLRTYARSLPDDPTCNEQWYQTIQRVINGVYSMMKRHILKIKKRKHSGDDANPGMWNEEQAQLSAKEMYDRFFNMKCLPPGRGLWAMGSNLTEARYLFASLNNCGYVSTKNLDKTRSKPFCFLMDMCMLGVGIGADTKGKNQAMVFRPYSNPDTVNYYDHTITITIEDTREGWVGALKSLIESYLTEGGFQVRFDYSKIRKAGLPIKGFGGVSSGPQVLIDLLDGDDTLPDQLSIRKLLHRRIGSCLTSTDIVDIFNMIGRCVVAGNVRRTAEIMFGDKDDIAYLDLKNYSKNPQRASYAWTSNNSVYADIGMDYKDVCDRIVNNGEPGLAWLENMQQYSRMNGIIDNKDHKAEGGNPCLEQTLESYELCCLVETFPARHENLADFLKTIKYAYLYAKTVTLGMTHWEETNEIISRNRRIGCSVTGIAQFIAKHGEEELKVWLEAGYAEIQRWDKIYSEWFEIPLSIKTTSVKPSGTVSLLAGATPGVHFPISGFYLRNVRFAMNSPLLIPLKRANYPIEPDERDREHTMVVTFPIDVGKGVKTLEDTTMEDQLHLAALLQRHWADNQVSCTVTFNPKKEGHLIEDALRRYETQLKGISFLPEEGHEYIQAPYIKCTEDDYNRIKSQLKPLVFSQIHIKEQDMIPDILCDGDTCLSGKKEEKDTIVRSISA